MTPDTRALIIDALRAQAGVRQRAATRAAGELARDKAAGTVNDVRPSAVRIAGVLAEAAELTAFADRLGAGAELVDERTGRVPETPAAAETPAPAAAALIGTTLNAVVAPAPVTLPAGTTADDIAAAVAELHADAAQAAVDERATDEDLADVDAVLGAV